MSEASMLRASGVAPEAARQFLTFELGTERYALALASVREIAVVPPITEVPRSPHEVLGVISVRGAVTTLIDLRRKLRLPEAPRTSKSRVLLVDSGSEVIGLLVDAVHQVARLLEGEIELASVLGGEAPGYLLGLGRPGGAAGKSARSAGASELLLLLDPASLLRGVAKQ